MVQQYLNKDGYPMSPDRFPIFLRKIPKAGSMQRVARYIVCCETGMLKWIGHCEDCQWFKGHVKYKGVECSFNKNQKEMETEKTRLQKIVEQLEQKMMHAIVEAIEDGAKIEHSIYVSNGYTIDGVFVQVNPIDNITMCLNMKSEVISSACMPSREELEKLAEQKRAELEEIEKQLKSK